jgi:uncharacterized protein YkwD
MENKATGENIAAGFADPRVTLNQWVCDQQNGPLCAADKDGFDGHRANIMSPNFDHVGCGFAFNSS